MPPAVPIQISPSQTRPVRHELFPSAGGAGNERLGRDGGFPGALSRSSASDKNDAADLVASKSKIKTDRAEGVKPRESRRGEEGPLAPDSPRRIDASADVNAHDGSRVAVDSASSDAADEAASIAQGAAQQSQDDAQASPALVDTEGSAQTGASLDSTAAQPIGRLLESLAVQPSVTAPVSGQQLELKPATGQAGPTSTIAAAQLSPLVATGKLPVTPDASQQIEPGAAEQVASAAKSAQLTSSMTASAQFAVSASEAEGSIAGISVSTTQSAISIELAGHVAPLPNHKPAQRTIASTQSGALSTNGLHSTLVTNSAGGVNDPIAAVNPAAARAEQLNAAVRIENSTSIEAQFQHSTVAVKNSLPFAGDSALTNSALQSRDGASAASWVATAMGAEDEAFTAQVSRGMTAMMNQRGGAMSMRLTPPELGELRVQMTISRGVVTAEFQTSTAHAHSLLERGMNTLRAALESQGLTVDRLAVHGMAHAAGQSSLRDDSAGQWSLSHGSSQDRNNHDAAGGESRGRHEHTDGGAERRYASADFGDFMDELNAEGFTDETVAAGTGSRAA